MSCFFSPKVPLASGNRVFLFSSWNFSKCQGAAVGQKGLKTQYFAISRPWGVRSVKTENVKKMRSFREKPLGDRFIFPKVPQGPGNRVFLFSALNFSKCQGAALGQKWPKNTVFCDSPPLGVRSVKTQTVKKLRSFWEKLLGVRFFSQKCP